jgi:hypothetical protein
MRDLLNRAMLKRGDQLLSQIKTLLTGSPPAKEEDIRQYDGEIAEARNYFEESMPEGPFMGNYTAKDLSLKIDREYSVPELRATAEEIAINVVQRIFEVFNWNAPDPNMIRGWQQRLLSRTL